MTARSLDSLGEYVHTVPQLRFEYCINTLNSRVPMSDIGNGSGSAA
jgi:hypothetical protein